MKQYMPGVLSIIFWGNFAWAETATLPPSSLRAIAIAGDAGAPTFTVQSVGATYEVRARDFASGAVRNNVVYHRFDLSSLGDVVIQNASIRFQRVVGDTLTTGRFALYGLKDVAGNLAQNWTPETFAYGAEFDPAMFYDFVASSGQCPVNLANVVDFSQQEVVNGSQATVASDELVAFLQGRLEAGGQATVILGMPSQGAGNDKKMTFAYPGYSDPSVSVSLVVEYAPAALPPAPSNFEISSIAFSATPTVTIDWGRVDGAVEYKVYRRAAGETTPTLVATTTDPSYLDANVALLGTYYYSVVTVTAKSQSAPSHEFEVKIMDATLGLPAAPDGLVTASVSPATIDLSWNAVPNAIFYQVYRSTESDGAFSLVQTVTQARATDSDGLLGYRSYFYRIKAISAGGVSRFGETLTVPPRFVQGHHASKPKNLSSPSRGTYSIDLTWDASAGPAHLTRWKSRQERGTRSRDRSQRSFAFCAYSCLAWTVPISEG